MTGMLAMGGTVDRHRRLTGNGAGPPLGVVSLGDAWACTNPSRGYGIALGLAHAALLLRAARERHAELTETFAADTERELRPWYESIVAGDRARLREIEALRAGVEQPPPANPVAAVLPRAMSRDPDIFRAGLEMIAGLTLPSEVFARPGFAQRVVEVAGAGGPPPVFGPDREELLTLLR